MKNAHIKLTFRIFISLSILTYLYWLIRADQARMYEALTKITFVDIFIAIALLIFTVILQIWRWYLISMALSVIVSGRNLINIFLGATFYGIVLPSSMGGDAIRVAALLRNGVLSKVALSSVFLDRISGLMALLLMVVLAHSIYYFFGFRTPILISGLLISILAWIFIFAALFSFRYETFASSWWIGRFFFTLLRDFKKIIFSKTPGIMTSLISISIQILSSVSMYFIASSLQVEITLWQSISLIPIVMLATIIPISIAGWGVREGAIVLVFSILSIPADQAILTSIVFGILMTIVGLVCGFFWFCSPIWGSKLSIVTHSGAENSTTLM